MTTAEQMTLAATFTELGMTALGLYLTIISGFLVAAFFVGKQLTREQILFVVALFVMSAGFTIMGTGAGFYWSGVFFNSQTVYKTGDLIVRIAPFIVVLQIAGVMGALDFLRRIRKS